MKKIWKEKDLSWKSKKRIAELLCAAVMIFAMVLSLWSPLPQKTEDAASVAHNGNRMVNDGTTVSLQFGSAQIEELPDDDGEEQYADLEKSAEQTAVQQEEADAGENAHKESEADEKKDVEEAASGKESLQKTGDNLLVAEQSDFMSLEKEERNRVVPNTQVQRSGDGKNVVVKNPAPLTLVSTVFENHGEVPELKDVEIKYQYPVELGYAVDKNYDGKQIQKDGILSVVLETTPEQDTEENSAKEQGEAVAEQETAAEAETEAETETEKQSELVDGADKEKTEEEQPVKETEESESLPTGQKGTTESDDTWIKDGEKAGSVKKTTENEKAESTQTATVENQNTGEDSLAVEKNGVVKESENLVQEADVQDDGRKEFQKEIWSKVLPTEPVVVNEEEELEVEQETELETGEDEEQQDGSEEPDYETVTADAGYYIISGSIREGSDVFISDIEIRPSGVEGFDKVRIGEDGKFQNSVLLTKDGIDQSVELYFSDGEQITKGTVFTYSKDTADPVVQTKEDGCKVLTDGTDRILCTNDQEVAVEIDDGEDSAGLDRLLAVYGDRIVYVMKSLEEPKVKLAQDFYGRVLLSARDQAGNASDLVSQYYLIDQTAPEITLSDGEICTAPYTLWIDVAENGHIVSGIDQMECRIDGEVYEIEDLALQENVKLSDTLEVPSKAGFSITFEEEGSHEIEVYATDHAGNVTTLKKTITITQPELVAVYMPKEFTIHIDPQQLLGREQIFSDDITLDNVSNVDVKVTVENVELIVNDGISDTGIEKDCELYLVAPDTGEKIKLEKGSNNNIYSYRMPVNADGGLTGLHFVGTTTEGSEAMWKNSDIRMEVKLNFSKWEE